MEQCEFESAVIEYFGLQEESVNENSKIHTDFGQLVNLLAFYQQKVQSKEKKKFMDFYGLSEEDMVNDNKPPQEK